MRNAKSFSFTYCTSEFSLKLVHLREVLMILKMYNFVDSKVSLVKNA